MQASGSQKIKRMQASGSKANIKECVLKHKNLHHPAADRGSNDQGEVKPESDKSKNHICLTQRWLQKKNPSQ